MDYTKVEGAWDTIKKSIEIMSNGGYLNQDQLDTVFGFNAGMGSILQAMQEMLPKQIYGRIYRKEGDKYILDDNGDYVSFRGMFGAVWYRPKNWTPVGNASTKHVAPFQ